MEFGDFPSKKFVNFPNFSYSFCLRLFSPQLVTYSAQYDDLFATEGVSIDDEDFSSINPDEFLNLDEFLPNIKHEEKMEVCGQREIPNNPSLQQLTPPISPQPSTPIIIDSLYQKIRLIPMNRLILQQIAQIQRPTAHDIKRIKPIVPKPSSSSNGSDSDSNTIASCKTSISPIDKALMKQQRQIRNRESAMISRNKKKVYVETLEAENRQLIKENSFLKTENLQLKSRLKSYSAMTCKSASSISKKLPSKHATFLLAVVFMVGFNAYPIGNLFFKSNFREQSISVHPYNARHLLSLQNTSSISNESLSADSNEAETPIYFNQTDHIRKVNIENIRRWIPEPDLFNVTGLKKSFDFNPDPLQEKLAKMYEKSREQSQKNLKSKKRIPKKKPMMGPLQLYNSNLNVIKLNEFFDEINRKDDTFYVFSFKADHLLLPAIDGSYNFSQIKMNLIMPRNNGEFNCKHSQAYANDFS